MPWVFDSSIALAWCFEDERTPETAALLDRLADEPASVPNLWPLEIANVLSLAIRKRQPRISADDRAEFLAFLQTASVQIDASTTELAWGPIMMLADLHKLTIYDAAYLELAIRLQAQLATLDRDLRAAAIDSGVTVIP